MSDLIQQPTKCETRQDHPCSGIRLLLLGTRKDLGGFSVRRLMPSVELKMVGPWVFFDHLGPAVFAPGSGIDVRPHPHIGLATITYLFEGEILHRDNLGSVQPIRPGAINWMTAGEGIVHSERTGPETRAAGHTLHGLQLWLALPESHEQSDPEFHHYDAEKLPETEVEGCRVRVMIGDACGLRSPVRTFSPTLYLEALLPTGKTFTLPKTVRERAVYVVSGGVRTAEKEIPLHHMAVIEEESEVRLTATRDTRLVLIGGESPGPRLVWWNLVSTRQILIEAAMQKWHEQGFAPVPGETEFIPLPKA